MKFGTHSRLSLLVIKTIFKITDLDRKLKTWLDLVSKLQCAQFYEIWQSEQTEHANYECNTRQCLEHLRNYWLKMIIGSEWL